MNPQEAAPDVLLHTASLLLHRCKDTAGVAHALHRQCNVDSLHADCQLIELLSVHASAMPRIPTADVCVPFLYKVPLHPWRPGRQQRRWNAAIIVPLIAGDLGDEEPAEFLWKAAMDATAVPCMDAVQRVLFVPQMHQFAAALAKAWHCTAAPLSRWRTIPR